MELYLDLSKAQGQTAIGTTAKKEPQSVRSAKESSTSQPAGVANDSATYDDPDKGRKWKHTESQDDELEEDRQAANKQAQDRNLVPTPEEVGGTIKKAFDLDALDMVKSLTSGLRDSLNLNTLSTPEVDFLHIVKGFSHDEIKKGNHLIVGKDRALFSAFLCERALASVDKLYRR